MGIFTKTKPEMARETPKTGSSEEGSQPPSSDSGAAGAAEPQRPGTSGTEMLLVNNRQRASVRLRDAQRKERAYKTKKRSTQARANWGAAKQHFKEGFAHNTNGLKLTWRVVSSVGYLFRAKNDKLKAEAEEKRRMRAADKQRRLEERLRREKELAEKEAAGEGEGEGAKKEGEGEAEAAA
ncbi:hypothetical protein KVR01_002434 [Diaporthe batatas]|uniref:uncharacterized protein n=1 Tax=Diaporthe batatas TaxID=748121 RepID=UPI001D051F06|nr:uncharacterized protein KVR01_002434 [Diaporthe batatas]KAG8166745.1 hypothetical protein KVR01_002434 [Diaporthe batatas]